MAKVCSSCGKGPSFGNNRSHSMRATPRRFDPNLQKVRIMVGSTPAQFAKMIADEAEMWRQVLLPLNIKLE